VAHESADDHDQKAGEADAAGHGIHGMIARVRRLIAWVQSTREVRAFQRYSGARGPLLAGGMSYQALFAIFAALWLVFAVAGIWITSNKELLDSFVSVLNSSVPGLVGKNGAVSVTSLTKISGTLGWTGIIAAIGLLWTAIGWLASTRQAIRAMFALGDDPTNFVLQKLRDLGLAAGFGLLLIAAAVVSLVATALLGGLFELVGISRHSFWALAIARTVSFIVTAAINTVTLAMMYRVLSHLRVPWGRLFIAAGIGGVALAVLSIASGLVLGGATKNPLIASFAVILALLIWFNFVCQVMLICAAWLAQGMADDDISARRLTDEQRRAEDARKAHDAQVALAEVEVDRAKDALAQTHRFARGKARRRLSKARKRLDALQKQGQGQQ
jgi:membrane protein